MTAGRLFPADTPHNEWVSFHARDYPAPVVGIVSALAAPACCGVPLGGLGTGCLDIQPTGVLGYSSILPTRRRKPHPDYQATWRYPQLQLPFLGISVGSAVWVLAAGQLLRGGEVTGCVEPGMNRNLVDDAGWNRAWTTVVPPVRGVRPASEIEYWGHYPFVDMTYQLDGPVQADLRAWSPFLPGDAAASGTPVALFEVTLYNGGAEQVEGRLAVSFPGPRHTEREITGYRYDPIDGAVHGVAVTSADGGYGYVLGACEQADVRVGGGLHRDPDAWASIGGTLPPATTAFDGDGVPDGGASVSVGYRLPPHGQSTVELVLAWYAPEWTGGGYHDILAFEQWDIGPYQPAGRDTQDGVRYTAMYATRYADATDVARTFTAHRRHLRARQIAWQAELYGAQEYPDWLRDSLLNSLSLLTEDAYWAAPGDLGAWARPNGAFNLVESPRGCAIMGCIVSNWYGDLPLLYLFPELERAVLANYAAYFREDGAAPFLYPNGDLTKPTYEWLLPLNGTCFVDLVDRLWQRTGDRGVLDQFYEQVKRSLRFTMNLVPPPHGVVGVHRVGTGQEWWEHTPVRGLVSHVAGLRLASLQMGQRMAEAVGDDEFAEQCKRWFDEGSRLTEDKLWRGAAYRFFLDEDAGEGNDDILSSQLDGDWASFAHGFTGVFQPERARIALRTIAETCLVDYGVAGFASPDGTAQLAAYGSFTAEMMVVGMTYLYHGQTDLGTEIVRRCVDNLFRHQRHNWDIPNMVRCDTGERNFGTDYFQNLALWGMPAALSGTDIADPCRPGRLVARLLEAAAAPGES